MGLKGRTHDGWLSCSATQITSHCWKHNTKQQHSAHHLCPIHKTNKRGWRLCVTLLPNFPYRCRSFSCRWNCCVSILLPPRTKKKEERASLILNQRWRRKGVMEILKVLRRRMNVMNVKITQFTDGEWERVRSVTRLLDVVLCFMLQLWVASLQSSR